MKTQRTTILPDTDESEEFIAEVMSNAKLQTLMSKMYISPEVAAELGLPPVKKWTLWGAFTDKVRELLKMPPARIISCTRRCR